MSQPADEFKDVTFHCLKIPGNELDFDLDKGSNLLHVEACGPSSHEYVQLVFDYETVGEIRNLLTAILARMEE